MGTASSERRRMFSFRAASCFQNSTATLLCGTQAASVSSVWVRVSGQRGGKGLNAAQYLGKLESQHWRAWLLCSVVWASHRLRCEEQPTLNTETRV